MHRILVVLMGLLSVSTLAWGGKPTTSTCPPSSNVTVTVYDYGTTGALLLEKSDDFNGANQAQYSVTSDPYLTTNISCGRLRFNLYGQSGTTQAIRTMYITPNQAIDGSQPAGPPPGYYWQNVELASGCYDQNGNQVYVENILTSSNNCGIILDFNANGTKYKLQMGPGCSGCVGVPAPTTTGLLTVTCNSVSNSQCVSWTFAPNMTPSSTNPPTVANLYYYAKGGKLTFFGQYYMTFRIDATNP
jgi:hypothetical protein